MVERSQVCLNQHLAQQKQQLMTKKWKQLHFFFLLKKEVISDWQNSRQKEVGKRKGIALSSALNTSYHFLSAVNTKLPPGSLMWFLEWWKSISIHRSHTICGLSADIPMLWRNPAHSCHYHNKDSSQHLKQVWFIWRDTGWVGGVYVFKVIDERSDQVPKYVWDDFTTVWGVWILKLGAISTSDHHHHHHHRFVQST